MKRERVEERKWFAPEEKDFILSKSHGRCCHCGRKISVGKDFTVEHIIPLAKGGTNDITNIVALCKECNDQKQDRIIDPRDYLKYLDDVYMYEAIDNQMKYYEEYNWFSKRNFIPVDKRVVDVEFVLPQLSGKKGKKKQNLSYSVKYMIDRATYADLDSVYEYIWKYNKRYNINSTRQGLKSSVSDVFEKGAFYIIRSGSKEMVAVIPVALTKTDIVDNADMCTLTIRNPICLYNKQMYIELICDCIMDIVCGASEQSFIEEAIPVKFEKFKNDPVASKVYRLVGGEFGTYKFDLNDFEQSIILMSKNCGSGDPEDINYEDTLVRMVDDKESISDEEFMQCIETFSNNIINSLDIDIKNIISW